MHVGIFLSHRSPPPSSAARKSAAPAHMRRWFDNVPPPYHPVNNDSYTRHLNTALRAVTRSVTVNAVISGDCCLAKQSAIKSDAPMRRDHWCWYAYCIWDQTVTMLALFHSHRNPAMDLCLIFEQLPQKADIWPNFGA